jgi:hypothetical protein
MAAVGGGRLGHHASARQLAAALWTASSASASMQGFSRLTEMILSLAPTRMVKERPLAQDGIGAVVGPLQGWDDIAAGAPRQESAEEVPRKLLWQVAARVVLVRYRKNSSI